MSFHIRTFLDHSMPELLGLVRDTANRLTDNPAAQQTLLRAAEEGSRHVAEFDRGVWALRNPSWHEVESIKQCREPYRGPSDHPLKKIFRTVGSVAGDIQDEDARVELQMIADRGRVMLAARRL